MKVVLSSWINALFLFVLMALMGVSALLGVRLGDALTIPLILVAAFSCIVSWMNGRKVTMSPALAFATVGFALWTMVSLLFSATATVGLSIAQNSCALVLLFFWAVNLPKKMKEDAKEWMTMILPWIAVLCCLGGIAVYTLEPFSRFVGTFVDPRFAQGVYPNGCAAFLLLTWPLVWMNGKNRAWMRWVVTGLLLACLLLTLSRGALLVFAIQVIVLCWKDRPSASAIVGTIISTIIFLGFITSARSHFFPLPSPSERITFTDASQAVPVTERRDLWVQALMVTLDRPITGWGPGSFLFTSQKYQQHVFAVSDDPHNVLLNLSAERGVPAALLFVMIVVYVFTSAWKSIKKNPLLLGIMIGTGGLLVHSMIDRDFQFLGITLPFWILLGLLSSGETSNTRSFSRGMHIAMSALALVLFGSIFCVQPGEAALGEGQNLGHNEKWEQAVEVLGEYVTQNSRDARGWVLYGEALLATKQYNESLKAYDMAFMLGRYNYPEILSGTLRLAAAVPESRMLDDRLVPIENMTDVFIKAIISNDHYAAITTAPDVIEEILDELSALNRKKAARYQQRKAEVIQSAAAYRTNKAQAPEGLLWR